MGAKKTALILTAAGTSERFGANEKKEYQALQSPLFPGQKGGTVLSCSAEPFLFALTSNAAHELVRLIITLPPQKNDTDAATAALFASPFVFTMLNVLGIMPEFIAGGTTRQESVLCALEHLNKNKPSLTFDTGKRTPDLVLIHDAARPFVSPELVKKVLHLASEKGACAPGIPAVDTVKEIHPQNSIIVRHLKRSRLAAVQTPQCFYFKELLDAHQKACSDGKSCTDDTEIWASYAGNVHLCEGERTNVKITYSEDLPKPASKLQNTPEQKAMPKKNVSGKAFCFRIGLGSDTHKLAAGRPLLIGGVHIPFDKGEKAHSDGDVLLHAITDALLGAASLGDIGELFPPCNPQWKNADSAQLLKTAWDQVRQAGWQLENLDCVLIIERPKILEWREQIRKSIAGILSSDIENVFVKAKTAEGLGDIGKQRAVSALCTCLLKKKSTRN